MTRTISCGRRVKAADRSKNGSRGISSLFSLVERFHLDDRCAVIAPDPERAGILRTFDEPSFASNSQHHIVGNPVTEPGPETIRSVRFHRTGSMPSVGVLSEGERVVTSSCNAA
jgi:hypothetical protein